MQLDKLKSIAIIIACLVSAQLWACVSTPEEQKDEYLSATGEITENAARFIGKSVLVRNDVLETVGTTGFILDKDRLLDGEPLLVINTSTNVLKITDDETPEVVVDGKIKRLDINSIKQQYSLNLEPDLYSQYAGKLVIIATSVILSPDPEDITANPELYYDRPLAIKGEVDDVEAYGIFKIDEEKAFGGEDLIVIQPEPRILLNESQTVIVYGVVRQFIIEELERDYAVGWDLAAKTEIEAKYNQKPVFIANKIEVIK